jgi:SAM-dependent methyltransferase
LAKQGELEYIKNLKDSEVEHAFNKPFSDPECPRYLFDMGTFMHILPPPPARILDLGVGTGWTSIFFALRGYNVTGQDISEDMINLAEKNKSRYRLSNLHFLCCDYESMNFNEEFDYALFYDSLHHSVDEFKALQSVYRALKKGGICLTCEPGYGHSKSEGTKKTIERFGVTERDMHPRIIINSAKKAGFRKHFLYNRLKPPMVISGMGILNYILDACKQQIKAAPVVSTYYTQIVKLVK